MYFFTYFLDVRIITTFTNFFHCFFYPCWLHLPIFFWDLYWKSVAQFLLSLYNFDAVVHCKVFIFLQFSTDEIDGWKTALHQMEPQKREENIYRFTALWIISFFFFFSQKTNKQLQYKWKWVKGCSWTQIEKKLFARILSNCEKRLGK